MAQEIREGAETVEARQAEGEYYFFSDADDELVRDGFDYTSPAAVPFGYFTELLLNLKR